MIIIGLTGNAGGGKSTAMAYFASQGIDGISTDAINAELRQHCTHLCQWLQKMVGTALCDDNGRLDSNALRQEIFTSQKTRRSVEHFLHPVIMQNVELQLAVLPAASSAS